MNFLSVFENRVSGIFGATRAPFSFKKLAKQAAGEMEDQTLVINGVTTAPALYTVLVANEDDPLLAPFYPDLSREVAELVKAQANKKRYTFVGEPLVRFMIDPSLKSGRFSVFAENVDAPTLGRLYEEERAYQRGLSGATPARSQRPEAPSPSPAPLAGRPSAAVGDPFAADPFGTGAEASVPVPQTMLREQMPGMGGAAATGAAMGGIAANMANARTPQQQAAPLAEIVDVVTGEGIRIDRARAVVGRERAAADVILRDPNVSRRHAEFTYTGSGWSIEDLNSTNGTLVNNRRITRCPLRNGDLLTFGLSTFEFRG